MSWSAGTKVVAKGEADAAVDALTTGTNDPMHEDQLRTAQIAAKAILCTVPGPFVSITMSGHANGVGWQAKTDWANDCISVNVSQSMGPATA